MTAKFLHLGINFTERASTPEALREIEEVLNKSKDWYRYAPNCWLIYTGQTAKTWNERLKRIPWMAEQRYLITAVNIDDRSGLLLKDTWDWIKSHRPVNE